MWHVSLDGIGLMVTSSVVRVQCRVNYQFPVSLSASLDRAVVVNADLSLFLGLLIVHGVQIRLLVALFFGLEMTLTDISLSDRRAAFKFLLFHLV